MQRIAKLEGLVKNVEGNSEGQGMTPERMDPSPILGVREDTSQMAIPDMHGPSKASSSGAGSGNGSRTPGLGLGRYLGTSFWVTLSEEINGLKDVLNSSSDEDDEVEDRQTPPSSLSSLGGQHLQQANDSGFVISPTSSVECPANPTPHQLYALCDIYLNNVDPIFKVLHAPSLRRYLQEGATILDCSPGFRGLGALRFAICYAATVSMTDGECRSRIGEERAVLMAKYRAGTEIALANADLVNTVEMSTLQAMTIYLVITSLSCYSLDNDADWCGIGLSSRQRYSPPCVDAHKYGGANRSSHGFAPRKYVILDSTVHEGNVPTLVVANMRSRYARGR